MSRANSVFLFKCIIVEASCHNGDETIETIEAAEALLNMDSPGPMLDEKRMSECYGCLLSYPFFFFFLKCS